MKLYKPLVNLRITPETKQIQSIYRLADEHKISVTLGQIVQVCIFFAAALGISLKNPMIFNGNRSYIHSDDTIEARLPPHKLFIPSKGEQNQMKLSVQLLEENLMKIFRGLSLLKERENIGFLSQTKDDEELIYPNRLIRLLHKICNF